ncbi:MAG: hypothetical protein JXR10_07265 [Cyclobacteriaceae bacterium]
MKRRDFVQNSALLGIGLSLPLQSLFTGCSTPEHKIHSKEYRDLVFSLLKSWCDGMIEIQINNPSDMTVHGFMNCPACDTIHARLQDAVYPFLYMAKATGDKKYLEAGINAFEWSNNNVSLEDGSWTNDINPKSWNGTTVFGAIALAEALQYHGDLLEEDMRVRWAQRLDEAAEFLYKKFPTIDATNVNYGATNIYALNLIGKLLDKPKYTYRSKALATEIKTYFTDPNFLLYGEIKPSAHKISAKGLPGVDLGYNVEESLNSIVMYAVEEQDQELLDMVTKSLNGHLEFMLPDGGWDNGWGTRMFKWTYWGSRTCDGSSPALSMLAGSNPALGTAAVKNTELLQRCTADGLLHGGPHYVSRGIKPCVHHTFAHAKPLAFLLDHWDHLPEINTKAALPRAAADGIKYFDELDVALFARGDWRGTVSAYDAEYHYKIDSRQATGDSLSLLYHNKVGLLCAASMAVYKQLEPLNQQDQPGEDIAFTPRIETYQDGVWFTNLFDLTATFESTDESGIINIAGQVALKNEAREIVQNTASAFQISYECSTGGMKITAKTDQEINSPTAFVLPILSPASEQVTQDDPRVITIAKPEGTVKVSANVPLSIKETNKGRSFNMVPGAEAVPIEVFFVQGESIVEISVEVV